MQGVGFRAFTKRTADAAGLRGWTRNLGDGRVEAMVSGPAQNLLLFEAKLREGPPHGSVTQVAIAEWSDAEVLNPTEFEIRKDADHPCQPPS